MTKLMRRPNPATLATEITALAYKRVSSEEQLKGYGLDVQDDALNAWEAEDPRRTILEAFSDEGVSGALDRRPDMLRLEERAREGKANRIVVPKVDRVGRTARAAFNWAWRMQDIGVHFIAIQERIDTSTELGWTMFQQYVFFSEMEWNRIRQRTMDGRNKKIEYGGWPAGPAPYGYKIEGKGQKGSFLVIDEDEARVILKATELIVDEKQCFQEAAQELNRLEMFTRSGRPWTDTNLYQRMHSETFDGYTTYRKTNRGDRKKATKLYEDGTPVHGEPVHVAVPQILTPDRTRELKAALTKRSIGKPRKPARIYTLSGHIASGCGRVYVGGGRTGQRAYRCQGTGSYKDSCGCANLDAAEVEAAVWEQQLEEVEHWLEEYEQTRARANAVVALARSSRERLADLTPAEKAEIFDMFHVAVIPDDHRFAKRGGAPCKVTEWHHGTGALVPPDVTEEQWEAVREVIAGYHGPRHFTMTKLDLRQALNGMLHRLRHGAEWSQIADWGDPEAVRHRQGVWSRSGAWRAIVEHLTADGRGTTAYRHPTIPQLHVVGEIRAGVLALMGATPDELTELTDSGSGFTNPISGMLRELALDAQKIAKAIARAGKRG